MNGNTLTIDDSRKLFGFSDKESITLKMVKGRFRNLTKKLHPEGSEYDGNKNDLSQITEAKQILIDTILNSGNGCIEEIHDFGYWVRKINEKSAGGCPKESIALDFGIDLISHMASQLCIDSSNFDFRLFHTDYDDYKKYHDELDSEIDKLKFICNMLDVKVSSWMSIIGDGYMKSYLRYFIDTDLSDSHLIENLNFMLSEFMIYDKNKFIESCNSPGEYIGNYVRLERIFSKMVSDENDFGNMQLALNFN